jgi:hypothetical protein
MKKSGSILLISIGIIVGVVGVLLLLSEDNGGALFVKEIKNIDNGLYLEITPEELKEQPEIAKSIRGGEGCVNVEGGGGWYCELTSKEVSRVNTFFNIKHSKFLFSIDRKFKTNLEDNEISAELVNIFNSNGFPLTQNYTTLDFTGYYSPYTSWFISKEADTSEYTVWEIKDELKVYKGYIEFKFIKIGEQYYEIQLAMT